MDLSKGTERKMLERILALLLALAGLADRAASLPAFVGLPALAILDRGEAVARSFVVGLARETGAPAPAAAACLASGDAMSTAAKLRALARLLGAILTASLYLAWVRSRTAGRCAGSAMPPLGAAAYNSRRAAQPAPDTS